MLIKKNEKKVTKDQKQQSSQVARRTSPPYATLCFLNPKWQVAHQFLIPKERILERVEK
jgi:hypothetical protein